MAAALDALKEAGTVEQWKSYGNVSRRSVRVLPVAPCALPMPGAPVQYSRTQISRQQFSTVQYTTVLHSTVLSSSGRATATCLEDRFVCCLRPCVPKHCSVLQYVLHCTVRTALYYCTYCTAMRLAVLCCTVLHCNVQYCTEMLHADLRIPWELYCTVHCSTLLHCVVLYCDVQYSAVLN